MRLLGQVEATSNGAGIVSQQSADEIFLLLDAALEVGNFFAGGVHELFGLADVELRSIAAIGEGCGQAESKKAIKFALRTAL